jgi:hypothetical protein
MQRGPSGRHEKCLARAACQWFGAGDREEGKALPFKQVSRAGQPGSPTRSLEPESGVPLLRHSGHDACTPNVASQKTPPASDPECSQSTPELTRSGPTWSGSQPSVWCWDQSTGVGAILIAPHLPVDFEDPYPGRPVLGRHLRVGIEAVAEGGKGTESRLGSYLVVLLVTAAQVALPSPGLW